ncbi:ERMES complex subunit [Clydaea vesicula]|uniref:ERMES complex subunit n=1 Tax=Clydaea vesicula TaxID=447962 RepID=A0AAD5TWC4_9FUNG|nr:ERMES complex subunit [Clydaea vesicula]
MILLITGEEFEELLPFNQHLEVPEVQYTDYILLDLDDGFLSLLTSDGQTKDDVKIPDGHYGVKLRSDFEKACKKGDDIPDKICDFIETKELYMGKIPPELEILEIGELSEDKFRGIFKLVYNGDAHIILQTKVQANPLIPSKTSLKIFNNKFNNILMANKPLIVPMELRISNLKLRGIVVLVVDKYKGVTLAFKNDPLEKVDVNSTFDQTKNIREFLLKQIQTLLRKMFQDDIPQLIHNLSLIVINENENIRSKSVKQNIHYSVSEQGERSDYKNSSEIYNNNINSVEYCQDSAYHSENLSSVERISNYNTSKSDTKSNAQYDLKSEISYKTNNTNSSKKSKKNVKKYKSKPHDLKWIGNDSSNNDLFENFTHGHSSELVLLKNISDYVLNTNNNSSFESNENNGGLNLTTGMFEENKNIVSRETITKEKIEEWKKNNLIIESNIFNLSDEESRSISNGSDNSEEVKSSAFNSVSSEKFRNNNFILRNKRFSQPLNSNSYSDIFEYKRNNAQNNFYQTKSDYNPRERSKYYQSSSSEDEDCGGSSTEEEDYNLTQEERFEISRMKYLKNNNINLDFLKLNFDPTKNENAAHLTNLVQSNLTLSLIKQNEIPNLTFRSSPKISNSNSFSIKEIGTNQNSSASSSPSNSTSQQRKKRNLKRNVYKFDFKKF